MSKEKTNNGQGGDGNAKTTLLPGGVSQEQLAKWKKEHGTLYKIAVERSKGNHAVCYLKPADRNITALAMSKMGAQKILEAGEVLLTNCWLGGDEDIKTNDRLFVGAATKAYEAFDFAESSVEKL